VVRDFLARRGRPGSNGNDMSANPSSTIGPLLTAAVRGEEAARQQLIHHAYERLRYLARLILNADFPRLKAPPALLDTTDVANQVALGLLQALDEIRPATPEDFFRLAAQRIRWLLLDHAKQTDLRARLRQELPLPREEAPDREQSGPVILAALYAQIEALPEKERAVVDLLYFHGLSQPETAALLGITERSVRRYWVSARLKLVSALKGLLPGAAEGLLQLQGAVRPDL
jgi:RNA polymerase sigma-70 factor (ECF subfamily)